MIPMINPKPEPAQTPIRSELATWELGQRVMLRVSLPEGQSHLYTDVMGYIKELTADAITLETRTGIRTINVHDVAIGKIIPPPPARRTPRTP